MNFAFYVSGNAGRLRKMINSNAGFLSDVKLIVSDDASNGDIADLVSDKHNIDYMLFDYTQMSGDKNLVLSNYMLQIFKKYQIDYCFSFGNHILKGDLLTAYKNRIINFHPSILPMFRGRNAIDQAISQNAFLIGCTAHFIDAGMDTGPVIMQCVMSKRIFTNDGYDAVLDTEIKMLSKIVELLINDRIVIDNEDVDILDADYSAITFYPSL